MCAFRRRAMSIRTSSMTGPPGQAVLVLGPVQGSSALTRDCILTVLTHKPGQGCRLRRELACDHTRAQAAPDRNNHVPRLSELDDIRGGVRGVWGKWPSNRFGW